MSLVPTYRRRPTPLHAARAGIGICYCAAFLAVGVLYSNPLVLGGALAGLVLAATFAGASAELRSGARLALPVAVLLVVINALVYREGNTVIFRGGEVLGRRLDVTLESLAGGGVAALRVLVVAGAFALYTAAVDPDAVLALLRRVSYRSALTGSLATRLIPVLQRQPDLGARGAHHELRLRVLEDGSADGGQLAGPGVAHAETSNLELSRRNAAVEMRHQSTGGSQERRLARAGSSGNHRERARLDLEREVAQRRAVGVRVGVGEIAREEDGVKHRQPPVARARPRRAVRPRRLPGWRGRARAGRGPPRATDMQRTRRPP